MTRQVGTHLNSQVKIKAKNVNARFMSHRYSVKKNTSQNDFLFFKNPDVNYPLDIHWNWKSNANEMSSFRDQI